MFFSDAEFYTFYFVHSQESIRLVSLFVIIQAAVWLIQV